MKQTPLVRVTDPAVAMLLVLAIPAEAASPGARALREACERALKGAAA